MSLKNVPFGTIDRFNVVVEIPKGSGNKYEYNEELDAITLEWAFTGGFCFPFDYGFIPQTLGGDNDPLDVFVISSHPFSPGIVVSCRTKETIK
jgi:inorganic pyrophosphatase